MKFAVSKDATPLFVVEASSPAIVIVEPLAEVSIPSPPATVKEPSSAKLGVPVSLSEANVIFGLLSFAAVILPANIAFVIPPALTCNASDTTAIEELSTFTSKVFPALTRAAPATT